MHACANRAFLSLAHADCVDRIHPPRRRCRVETARQLLAAEQSRRVVFYGGRVGAVVGDLRDLQQVLDSQLVLRRAS